jgi:hypothetical protein
VYWINELRNSSGTWVKYREGYCYGEYCRDGWVSCNKDFYENSASPNKLGGQGSPIKFQYFDAAGWTSWSAANLNDQ